MDQFKQTILETIDQIIEDGANTKPVIIEWRYPEKPDWKVALCFIHEPAEDEVVLTPV